MEDLSILKPLYGPYFLAKTKSGNKVKVPRTVSGEKWKGILLKENTYLPTEWERLNFYLRRVPSCGYYPFCSGCQWQHIRFEVQIKFKKALFKEYLGFEPDKVLISPSEWGYRIKTFLYLKDGKLGFKKAWFYDLQQPVLNIDHCPLLHSSLNKAIFLLKRAKLPDSLYAVELLANPQNGEVFAKLLFYKRNFPAEEVVNSLVENLKPAFAGIGIYKGEYLHWERIKIAGRWNSSIRIGLYNFLISPDAFIQPNYFLWKEFINIVRPLKNYRVGLELYSGIGFFTLHLSKFVETLYSSELSREATLLRKENLKRNGIKNVKVLQKDAYKHLKNFEGAELLVVDPPRGGLTKPLIDEILRKKPKEIIYISCNLESLRRDLEILKEEYKIVKSALVDQFPNTYHIESVIWLLKR